MFTGQGPVRRLGAVAAVVVLAGVLTTAALGRASGPTAVSLHAEFDSAVSNPTAACPSLGGTQVLVLGRGIGTGGPLGKFDRAVGTAAECSQGHFLDGVPVPVLGNCHNVTPGAPFFDVHGSGFYMTKDGSVLYLVYHEISENPFIFGQPPFELHDCGVWQVDGARSTGIFEGATGNGTITADVPVRADFSAHVSADYVGTVTLVDGAKAPKDHGVVTCSGTMNEVPITGDVMVEKGQSCDLEHSAVNGNVHVHKGGSLFMQHSIADGNVECDACGGISSVFSTSVGNLHVDNAASGSSIVGTVVHGNLDVHSSGPGTFLLQSNFVDGNLSFNENTGSSTVAGNTVAGTLGCERNNPAPVLAVPPSFIFGNTAAAYRGQCAP